MLLRLRISRPIEDADLLSQDLSSTLAGRNFALQHTPGSTLFGIRFLELVCMPRDAEDIEAGIQAVFAKHKNKADDFQWSVLESAPAEAIRALSLFFASDGTFPLCITKSPDNRVHIGSVSSQIAQTFAEGFQHGCEQLTEAARKILLPAAQVLLAKAAADVHPTKHPLTGYPTWHSDKIPVLVQAILGAMNDQDRHSMVAFIELLHSREHHSQGGPLAAIQLTQDELEVARMRPIDAIKSVKSRCGCSLLEAKHAVDAARGLSESMTAKEVWEAMRDACCAEDDGSCMRDDNAEPRCTFDACPLLKKEA
jgi:hypothetical protein